MCLCFTAKNRIKHFKLCTLIAKITFYIYFFYICLDFSKCGINVDPRRIAQSTAIGLWPWMGSLGTYDRGNWTHKCGASLIDDTKVITAAHCVLSEKKVLAR